MKQIQAKGSISAVRAVQPIGTVKAVMLAELSTVYAFHCQAIERPQSST